MKRANSARFIANCMRVGVAEDRALCIWNDMKVRYSESHRYYHNLAHIDNMLGWFDRSPSSGDATELAIWCHDVIYEPTKGDNEQASASYFQKVLGKYIDEGVAQAVERLIMATDPTKGRTGAQDEDALIDIDLSILGSPPEEYDAYRIAIRQEYGFVSDSDFTAGRSSILQKFLSQKIYATGFFADCEDQARANIEGELILLKNML